MSIMRVEKVDKNNVNPRGLLTVCGHTHLDDYTLIQVFKAVMFPCGYMYAQFSTHRRLVQVQAHSEYVNIGE